MKKAFYFLLVPVMCVLVSCSSGEKPGGGPNDEVRQSSVVVYGSNTCSHCISFKTKLDSAGIAYTFNDVDQSDEQALIMVDLVKKANFTGRIKFPVVHIDNEILLVSPEFEDFYAKLNAKL